MSKTEQITGAISGRVEILRDRAGVPHIYASTTPDLWFGVGLAMAQDRLWQMDRLRRRALGRQAEILGAAYVASDIAHLTVGIDQIATREAAALDENTHAICTAFVAGINRQVELYGRDLPPEFGRLGYTPEPFAVRDVVAIARGIWWSLNGRIDRIVAAEAARLLPEQYRGLYLTPEASEHRVLQTAAGTDDATGSNNWALHGTRTATGKPLLCGDPHQPFWVPSSWYRYRPAWTGGQCRGRRPSWFSRHVVGQQWHCRLGNHQQHGDDPRHVCRGSRCTRFVSISRW